MKVPIVLGKVLAEVDSKQSASRCQGLRKQPLERLVLDSIGADDCYKILARTLKKK